MATSSLSKATKQPSGNAPITNEEKQLLAMYRHLSRWDRNCIFTILQSLSHGRLTDLTDHWSWERLRRSLGLPKGVKVVDHA